MSKKKSKASKDQFENEFLDPAKAQVEVKVSCDGGDTWERRKISMVSGLEESGLIAGEIFQLNGERFMVAEGEDGLVVEQIKKPEREKSAIIKKPVKRK
ncbi:hypothetical protein [Desulfosporosinus youngiae]|uniref:Uncharacterized protein n=1 Tax=Desulfosporosinus youngiae DSM 17734 TaxID=768710 RepID=H5Y2Q8_9FIRM|nr:hypothetical protein [Desulfosporosinus youngiae]EHQ88321.1 hypothetical protein DesyoDRAFT_1151 [Desulfosporosinus youngiae DSM 17734]